MCADGPFLSHAVSGWARWCVFACVVSLIFVLSARMNRNVHITPNSNEEKNGKNMICNALTKFEWGTDFSVFFFSLYSFISFSCSRAAMRTYSSAHSIHPDCISPNLQIHICARLGEREINGCKHKRIARAGDETNCWKQNRQMWATHPTFHPVWSFIYFRLTCSCLVVVWHFAKERFSACMQLPLCIFQAHLRRCRCAREYAELRSYRMWRS